MTDKQRKAVKKARKALKRAITDPESRVQLSLRNLEKARKSLQKALETITEGDTPKKQVSLHLAEARQRKHVRRLVYRLKERWFMRK